MTVPEPGRRALLPDGEDQPATNAPAAGAFIGRSKELAHLGRALRARTTITCIHGLGGVGKTAIALEAIDLCLSARQSAIDWPRFERVVWVSARGRDLQLGDLLSSAASVLDRPGIGALPLAEQADSIRREFGRSACLLVVDNLETVTDPRVHDFLQSIPAPSRVLVTSREAVEFDANQLIVRGLSFDEHLALISSESERLGLPALIDAGHDKLLHLYNATGGAPLALKWAVGQLGSRGQTLDSVLTALMEADGDVFSTVFDRSWVLLTPNSRATLRAMPAFAGDAAWDSLMDVTRLGSRALGQALSQLVALNLVDASDDLTRASRRYSVHQLTRAFVAATGHPATEDPNAPERLLAEWVGRFVSEAVKHPDHWARLEQELPNIMKSMRWCHANQLWDLVIPVSIALREFLPDHGYWNESPELGQLGVDAAEAIGDKYHLGRLCVIPMGWVHRYREQLDSAREWYERGFRAFVEVGDLDRAAWAQLALANIHLRAGREPTARTIAEQVRDSGVGNSPVRRRVVYSAALVHLSEFSCARNEYMTASSLAREAYEVSLETGYINTTVSAAYWIGIAELRLGNLTEAGEYLRRSLELNAQGGVRLGTALCSAAIAELQLQIGETAAALASAAYANELYERLGMHRELRELRARVPIDIEAPQRASE